jgi:HD-GYP domain-containing protein (c-di-GMP phosphodiesterase class II)
MRLAPTPSDTEPAAGYSFRMADFQFVSRHGGSEQRYPLTPPGPLQIGRLEGCEVRLEDKQVSRRHARLEWNAIASGWRLFEAGGQTGTFVNGERLGAGESRDLSDGDIVAIGPVHLQLVGGEEAGATMVTGGAQPERETFEWVEDMPTNKFAFNDLVLIINLGKQLREAPDEVQTRSALVQAVARATGFANIAVVQRSGFGDGMDVLERLGDVVDRSGQLRMSRTMLRKAKDGLVLVTDQGVAGDHAIAASLERAAVNQAFCAPIGDRGRFGFLYADNGSVRGDEADRQRLRWAALVSNELAGMAGSHLDRLAHARDMVQLIADAVDSRDPCTGGHSVRVAGLARAIGRHAGLDERTCTLLYECGRVHDIGKIAVPDAVLKKRGPERLTEAEFALVRQHPQHAYNLLAGYPSMQSLLPGVLEHHEKWDGTGYPNGLRGEGISMLGRVLAIADVFDAITSDRPYRSGFSLAEARTIIERDAGTHFDPALVKAFLSIDPAVLAQHMQRSAESPTPAP